jgi:hypothetical protein
MPFILPFVFLSFPLRVAREKRCLSSWRQSADTKVNALRKRGERPTIPRDRTQKSRDADNTARWFIGRARAVILQKRIDTNVSPAALPYSADLQEKSGAVSLPPENRRHRR